MTKKEDKKTSVGAVAALVLGSIGVGIIVAFLAGYFLGHFTGHTTTETVSAVSAPASTEAEEEAAVVEPAAEEAPAETESASKAPVESKPEGGETNGAPKGGSKSTSKLAVEASPTGELKFTTEKLTAKAGEVEVDFDNKSPVPHDVAIEQGGEVLGETEVIAEGSDNTEVTLKPGTYTFFCTVPGHREAGMEGKLVVK